jgi:pimeloyl-ACP methyl ester carboxylesterase
MSIAMRTGADTVRRAVPTRRQELLWGIDNALRRPGADSTYADGDDSTWMSVDWPSMTRQLPVLGRSVNVVDTGGEGPAMVFVHGLGGRWQNWLLNIPVFMRTHRVIAPDLPGFGESEMPREEISIRGYAKVVDALLQELGIESAVFVGNSMGGFVSAQIALSFDTRVERLVLVAAAGLSIEYRNREPLLTLARLWAASATRVSAQAGTSVVTRPGLRRLALQLVLRYPERLSPAMSYELVQGAGAPGFMDALGALLGHSYRDELARIEVPVLIVWGRNDMLVPRGDAREYEDLIGPNARRVMFDDTGHVPMVERPNAFNALVADFLAEGAPAPPRINA